MRVERELVINAPRPLVWDYITDPANYTLFFSGITRWEVEGRKRRGFGARYRMLMRVGSAEVGGLVEVVEFDEPGDMAWTSVTGLDQRGRWRLREVGEGRTHVEFRLSYGVAGSGIFGWVSEQGAAPTGTGPLRRSLQQLKRSVEHDQLRRAAAQRRARPPA